MQRGFWLDIPFGHIHHGTIIIGMFKNLFQFRIINSQACIIKQQIYSHTHANNRHSNLSIQSFCHWNKLNHFRCNCAFDGSSIIPKTTEEYSFNFDYTYVFSFNVSECWI